MTYEATLAAVAERQTRFTREARLSRLARFVNRCCREGFAQERRPAAALGPRSDSWHRAHAWSPS